ncbi:translin-associated protein X-like [Malaya genurostris]|uniref:translin-associated protein X-like n=1 Tax=Malaya genurostris TaxID=325434 RepID=UPI0026F3EE21|nr:translin-associated protein X-like [Malaya genurostris]
MSYHRGGNRRGANFNKGGGNRYGGGGKRGAGKDLDVPVDENNPVVQCFREYARELDEKHDRYEHIVKCSRDITIESKRIIFLLHTVDAKKNNQSRVCDEAKKRLESLCQTHFVTIAKELHGLDPYQYTRAYTAGLQEFIEAYTFHEYVSTQIISNWKTIQNQLTYNIPTNSDEDEENSDDDKDNNKTPKNQISCLLPPLDFFLGIGDLSGEVMRKCINSLGSGDVESCFDHRRFMQELYKGFISVSNARSRDFSQKLFTLRQSLLKSENVCYNVKVRGGEAAKWGNTEDCAFVNISKDNLDEDEGVFF